MRKSLHLYISFCLPTGTSILPPCVVRNDKTTEVSTHNYNDCTQH